MDGIIQITFEVHKTYVSKKKQVPLQRESNCVMQKMCLWSLCQQQRPRLDCAHAQPDLGLAVSLQVTGYTVQYNGTIKALISVYSLADRNLHCSQINLMKKTFSQGSAQLL